MRVGVRRVVALAGLVFIPPLFLALAVVSGLWVAGLIDVAMEPSRVPEAARVYRRFGDAFTTYCYAGVSLAAGFVFAAFMWDGRRSKWASGAAFWILLGLVLPMAVANYWSADGYNTRTKQAVVDLVLVVLGSLCAVSLASMRTESITAHVLNAVGLALLVMEAILIPGIYGVLWLLNAQRAISLADTQSLSPGWVSAVAAVGGLAISILNFRKATGSVPAQSTIVRP